MTRSRELGLDLVEVYGGEIPVCRILDYKKYLFEQKSKLKKNKQKKTELKEFQLRPNTGEGDIKIRVDRAREFLQQGNMVKFTVKFKGREITFPEIGTNKLKVIESELADVSQVETPAKLLGKQMSITLMPRKVS